MVSSEVKRSMVAPAVALVSDSVSVCTRAWVVRFCETSSGVSRRRAVSNELVSGDGRHRGTHGSSAHFSDIRAEPYCRSLGKLGQSQSSKPFSRGMLLVSR